VSQNVVSRLTRRYTETGSSEECPKTGHPRITNKREDRLLTTSARRDPFTTAPRLRNQLRDATGINVSVRTVPNRLFEVNLKRLPLRRVSLTLERRRQRYDWCNNRVKW
ncbi:HTH Tnp Tc3 2 domain containing protein, partial [Asbolus verrucosus]